MATTTTNFGWDIPQSTDLVKDGATAIAALGQDIDTALVDLKGGTTGQILSKASNTDLDYTWITNEVGDITAVTAGTGISGGGTTGAVTITNSMATAIDAKGDLIAGTGADAFSRLAVGTNDQVLVADSTTATGLKWATPAAGGGMTLLSTTSMSGSSTVTVSVASGYTNLMVEVIDYWHNANDGVGFRLNTSTTAAQRAAGWTYQGSGSASLWNENTTNGLATLCNGALSQAQNNQTALLRLYNVSDTNTMKIFDWVSRFNTTNGASVSTGAGSYSLAAAITSVSIVTSGTYQAGTIKLWGIK